MASEDIPANGQGGPATAIPAMGFDKPELRARIRAARRAFVAALASDARTLAFSHLDDPLARLFVGARAISAFVPIGDEADPLGLARIAAKLGKTICLPRIEPGGDALRFCRWNLDTGTLERGPLAIPQPSAEAEDVAPDLMLTPLLGFDRALGRIGQGKGYYDRAFARLPDAIRIGIAWSAQEVDALPLDPWDVPLHAVLTEREWIGPA